MTDFFSSFRDIRKQRFLRVTLNIWNFYDKRNTLLLTINLSKLSQHYINAAMSSY